MRGRGIMSGTSLDGVDYALCEVERASGRLLKHWSRKFPKELQRRRHAAATNEAALTTSVGSTRRRPKAPASDSRPRIHNDARVRVQRN